MKAGSLVQKSLVKFEDEMTINMKAMSMPEANCTQDVNNLQYNQTKVSNKKNPKKAARPDKQKQ